MARESSERTSAIKADRGKAVTSPSPVVLIGTKSEYSGPIPQASDLKKYESVLAGSADRILKMAELEQENRWKCDSRIINSGIYSMISGQILTFVFLTVMAIMGFWLLLIDKSPSGLILSLASLAAVFFNQHQDKDKKQDKKD